LDWQLRSLRTPHLAAKALLCNVDGTPEGKPCFLESLRRDLSLSTVKAVQLPTQVADPSKFERDDPLTKWSDARLEANGLEEACLGDVSGCVDFGG
jgi:hypothetical protein